MNLVLKCRMLVFEWERFGLKSFWKDTSLHTHTYVCMYVCVCVCVCVCIYMYIYVCLCIYMYVCMYTLVSFQKDSRLKLSHSNTNIRHSNTRSTPLKLIYIILSIYKKKSSIWSTFCPCSREKTDGLNNELVRLTV